MPKLVRRGVVAGVLGGVAVIAVYFLYDLVRLEPLGTPRLLSRAMLGQALETSGGLDAAGTVLEILDTTRLIGIYTLLHLTVFAGLGVGAAMLFARARLPMNVLTGALFGGLAGSMVYFVGIASLAPELLAAPDWRLLIFANGIAGVVMVAELLPGEGHEEDSAAI